MTLNGVRVSKVPLSISITPVTHQSLPIRSLNASIVNNEFF